MASLWLPDTALTDGALARRLETLVTGWSKDWLGHDAVVCRTSRASDAAPRDGLVTLADGESGVTLSSDVASRSALSGQLLKFNPPTSDLDPQDLALVDSLLEAASRDLVGRLNADADGAADFDTASSACIVADLIVENRWMGRLSLPRPVCVAIRKRGSGAPDSHRASGSMDEALSETEIGITAKVGTLSLALDELNGLAKGDVIVLDAGMDASFAVMIDGTPDPDVGARYVLTETADKKSPRAGLILEMSDG